MADVDISYFCAPCKSGGLPAQDAAAQGGLHLGHGFRIHAGGGVEDHTRPAGLITGLSVGINIAPLARHFLKHAVDCANVEVHMLIEAGAKPVDELAFGFQTITLAVETVR